MSNIVAIVGRPNVGKSTFFNRMVGGRQAIIDDVSGVTRDRQYGESEWNGKYFTVVDTGGFVRDSDDVFEAAIRDQVQIAIEEASVIVFMVDAATGITDLDQQVADMLRPQNKPVILAVNKVDNNTRLLEAQEFWSLGFEDTFFVASISGSGSGDLLDVVVKHLDNEEESTEELPKFAIVGQPNAGKSSFINALIGQDRNIVTNVAGTTRDSLYTVYNKYDKEFILIDTAGLRRKSRVHEDLEFYSVMRAIRALEAADVCFLMIDATLGVQAQDLNIFRLAQRRNKGIVLLFNKWDLVLDKETQTAKEYEDAILERIAPFTDVPIVFISALTKQRISKALDVALQVYENRTRKIPTSQLNKMLEKATERYAPPAYRGKNIKIKYVTQLPTYYPAFAFFCNHPKHIRQPYKNYLENQLRETFELSGVPIGVFFREK